MMFLACLYWLFRFVGESSFPSTRKGFNFDQQMKKKREFILLMTALGVMLGRTWVSKPNKLLICGVIIQSYSINIILTIIFTIII